LGTAWQRRYGDFDINPELVCGRDADPPEASTARLVDSRAASGREAAVRIAESFHNFCASARMLQKNGDFIFLASVISNSCAGQNVAKLGHFTTVARLICRAAFRGMGVHQFLASKNTHGRFQANRLGLFVKPNFVIPAVGRCPSPHRGLARRSS
jgi:hypothetical protein